MILTTLQTGFRPDLLPLIVFLFDWDGITKYNPRHLGRGEDMHIRLSLRRIIQRADCDKFEQILPVAIKAPDHELTFGASSHLSITATCARRWYQNRFLGRQRRDAVRLNYGIEHECTATFLLAPGTVTAVHNQWWFVHSISNCLAGTTALCRLPLIDLSHGSENVNEIRRCLQRRLNIQKKHAALCWHCAKDSSTTNIRQTIRRSLIR